MSRVEAGIFAWELYEELAERAEQEACGQESTMLDEIQTSYTSVTNEPKHQAAALERVERMRSLRGAEATNLGRTFARDASNTNAFSKLSRYVTTIERGLYKTLHELERR